MENIFLPATDRSPQVDFDFQGNRLTLSGESYPEDAASFFGPLLAALKAYLKSLGKAQAVLDVKLAYFNSSSAKALMNMFQMLEEHAGQGGAIVVNWHYHPDDDTMEEFGEDFAEDFEAAEFKMCPFAE